MPFRYYYFLFPPGWCIKIKLRNVCMNYECEIQFWYVLLRLRMCIVVKRVEKYSVERSKRNCVAFSLLKCFYLYDGIRDCMLVNWLHSHKVIHLQNSPCVKLSILYVEPKYIPSYFVNLHQVYDFKISISYCPPANDFQFHLVQTQ